jgi:branched-chain amino acid transport system substrate-binding protein
MHSSHTNHETAYSGDPNSHTSPVMDLILDTCDRLADRCSDQQAMIEALRGTRGRESVLGTYDIDDNGDTTLTDYGVYRIDGGELVFDQAVKGKGG